MADDEKDPQFWRRLLKRTLGTIVVLILVGLGVYYSAEYDTYRPGEAPPDQSWGIAKDSPLRQPR